MRARRSARGWGLWLGLLALAIQLAAVSLPMPARAGMPVWLAGSLCQGAPADGREQPAPPSHLICPVCFVLSAAASAVPPQSAALVCPFVPPAATAIPRALGGKRQYAGFVPLSRAPPAI
jgi:hypothetical protein